MSDWAPSMKFHRSVINRVFTWDEIECRERRDPFIFRNLLRFTLVRWRDEWPGHWRALDEGGSGSSPMIKSFRGVLRQIDYHFNLQSSFQISKWLESSQQVVVTQAYEELPVADIDRGFYYTELLSSCTLFDSGLIKPGTIISAYKTKKGRQPGIYSLYTWEPVLEYQRQQIDNPFDLPDQNNWRYLIEESHETRR